MKKQKSFTLIEVLVVIALIGLSVSIILVAIKGTREKAGITKVIQFGAQIHHALGAYIVGEWKFENNPNDSSGNENHGSWVGTAAYEENDVHSELGYAGEFDGASYVEIPDPGYRSKLDVREGLTIEAWVRPDDASGDWYVVSKFGSYYLLSWFWMGEQRLYFETSGLSAPNVSVISPLQDKTWHHYVGTYDGNQLRIFVDGKQIGSGRDASGEISDSDNNLFIGCMEGNYRFSGLIDEVNIYDGGLTSAQIQKLYAEGAMKKGLLVKK